MSIPNSRASLIEYCMRSLGAPVIEINVDDAQVDDRVDEAIQFYQQYHSDAVVRTFYKYQITQTDITNEYITLPEQLIAVLRVLPINSANSTSGIFSVDYQMHLNDLYDLRRPGSLINYEMTRQYMSLIDMTMNGMDQGIIFSRHKNQLRIAMDWSMKLRAGQYIVIEGYNTIDPDQYVKVYNDMYLKRLLTAYIKKQWGENLIKFEGMQLPGGVTMNGKAIFDDAVVEIKDLEEQIQARFEAPVDFYVG